MSIALKGHLVSEETQNKIRISQMGNTHCLGRQLSLKTRQKISRSHIGIGKGIPLSIEQRHKQSETNKRIGRRTADTNWAKINRTQTKNCCLYSKVVEEKEGSEWKK